MSTMQALIRRNVKMYFKDKGLFFTSLITPMILLVLYSTFLKNVYQDSIVAGLPANMVFPKKLIEGLVSGQLVSSLLAVSCVTVAFCSNFLMVQDKANDTIKDIRITPVKSATLSVSYYVASLLCTMLICFAALGVCLLYIALQGWYLSAADVCCLVLDVILLVLFGTAISSVINFFLSSRGQISAVGTLISSGYGFICGAYMPISAFSKGLQRLIGFLPGTYGTSLLRNHAMGGALQELKARGLPQEALVALENTLDCNLYFYDKAVSIPAMYGVLALTVALLIGIYVLMNLLKKK